MNNQELYQKLYDDPSRKYGQAKFDRCPGLRLLRLYREYLTGKIIDYGCGTGDTIAEFKRIGYEVAGYDFIKPINKDCTQADITKSITDGGSVAICMDVFEHLTDAELVGLIENLKSCYRQIISIHNGPSTEGGGIELHVNKKSFVNWEHFLGKNFDIIARIKVHENQKLYICERKK